MPDPIDQHSFICALKDLALSLGRTPTRNEFLQGCPFVNAKDLVSRYFGGYTQFIHAAGLDPVVKQKKITNAVFEKSVSAHLEQYEPIEIIKRLPWPKIAIAGDMHEPFSCDRVKQDFKLYCAKFQPEYIVQIGDAFDMYSHSKFPRSHNVFTPQQEEETARKRLEEFWGELRNSCKNARCVMLVGNHDLRPIKRVLESVPTIEHWAAKYLKELLTFDGVETVHDHREEYLIAGIAFIHGFKSGYNAHADHLMRNTVLGHTHRGHTTFKNYRNQTIWELNAGYMADPESKGLTYTATKTTGWTLGFASIDEHGPRFIPA